MSRVKQLPIFIGIFLIASAHVFGQVTTGSLQGIIKDPNGAVVPGAHVKIINVATGITREVVTNGDGFYRVTNLNPADTYTVEVAPAGYNAFKAENVSVRLATENSLDIQLTLQGASAVVTVTGGDEELIQTTQNQLKTDFTPQQLTQLPISGAGIDTLALLVPGVVTPQDTAFSNGIGISANGNRGRSNNFQIDGQDNNDNSVAGPTLTLTNTEAIGQFQVITNNFSAEFGRNSGAQINTITKTGTNNLHGSIFEFHDSSALNARNNFDKLNQATFKFLTDNGFKQFTGLAARGHSTVFHNNQLGFSLGGPIKKNKAFFFGTYEGTYGRGEFQVNNLGTGGLTFERESALLARQLFSTPGTAQLVSTAIGGGPAFVQGVGTFYLAPPVTDVDGNGVPDTFNYGVGNPFGNPVTANRLAPSLFVCTITPAAGDPCPAANLRTLYTGEGVRTYPFINSNDQIITREDFNLTSKDNLSVRYIFNDNRLPLAIGRSLAGAYFQVPSRNHNIGATYTRAFSGSLTNEARFNYSYLFVTFGDTASRPGPGIGFSGQRDEAENFGSLSFGTPNNLPQSRKVVTYQEQDTVSTTIGNHAVKAGFDFHQQKTLNFFLPNFLGTYTFRGTSNSGTVPANTFYDAAGQPRTGLPTHAFENLILNRPRDISFALGDAERHIDQNDYFGFVQDDWRLRPNLTLNLGLRYEVSTQPFNKLIDELNARENDASTSLFTSAFPIETRTLPHVLVDTNNLAPRVGFAWSPNFRFLGDRFSNGRTVVRGGWGISYDPSFFNIVLNTITAAPFVGAGFIRQNNPGTAGQMLGLGDLPKTAAQLAATPGTNSGDPRLFNQTRVANDFRNPFSVNYNLGVQQEMWKDTVLEVRYVGTLIRDQFQTVNANPDLRALAAAGQYVMGDPTFFTSGTTVTKYTGTGAVTPTNGTTLGSYNTRGVDATGTRITGSGRLDPNFGPVRLRNNGANGRYDAVQTEFRTRLKTLALNANYTFSKTVDNASEIFSSFGGGQTIATAQNPFDPEKGERGLSAFHQKHNFTANFVYDVPFHRDQKGAAGKLLGGYQLTGIVRLGSGRPYTPLELFGTLDAAFEGAFLGGAGPLRPFYGNVNAPVGTIAFGAAAASLLGDTRPNAGQYVVYNTLSPGSSGTVVSEQQALQQARLIYNDFGLFTQGFFALSDLEAFNHFRTPYGDVGRNTFFGDPFRQVDLSVLKRTQMNERFAFEFRTEFTNLLNHRNFGIPNTTTESAFTAVTASKTVAGSFQNPGFNQGSNRSIRFGAKLIF